MIEINGYFSENEMVLIGNLNAYFNELAGDYVYGKVINRGDFVRYEIYIGEQIEENEVILQFCVKDEADIEEGYFNFVHISNILISKNIRKKGIAKGIITIMSKVSNLVLRLPFYITGIVNDEWKESLLCHGGEEDEDGDVKIEYEVWRKINTEYGIAYLNKEGKGYSDSEPFIYNCCNLEELKMVLKKVSNEGYKKLVPFYYSETIGDCSWEDVEKNRVEIEV